MHAMATHNPETTQQWRMQFASTARCVPLVRTQVRKALHERGYARSDIDDAVLVASELATNAVVHGHFPGHLFEVGLTPSDDTCLIEVSDSSPRLPRALAASAADESGRGLQLVSTLALHVGQRPRKPVGKTVWATLRMADGQGPNESLAQRQVTAACAEPPKGR
ncbi:ATP-binding protein [Streptomyces diacarni]|uniref:ATP-binding protein n=1 Tax=Streptomyces diacarni TaxID=2800381 RepID=UPI0033F4E856